MKFTPKSAEELKAQTLLKEGVYHFSVLNAKDKISKSGNEMIELTLEIFDNNSGSTRHIFDYLLEAMAYKLHDFCLATGMEHHYSNGTLKSHDCIGKSAQVELIIQKGKENPQGGDYPDKNSVKRYIARTAAEKTSPAKTVDAKNFDDDIPF